MKRSLIIALAFCAFLTACRDKAEKQPYFYKKMKGTIGNDHAVTLDLTRKDTVLFGSTYFDDSKQPLFLSGKISPEGDVELNQTDRDYNQTSVFTGKFTSQETLEGTWTNQETGEILLFKLTETKEGVAAVSYETFSKKFCKRTEKNKKTASEDMFWTDTMCSSLAVDIIQVTGPEETANGIVNKTIVGLICGEKFTTFKEWISSLVDTDDTEFFESEYGCEIKTNDRNILCTGIVKYDFLGGAHGMQTLFYHNFDLMTGKKILLSDILIPGYGKKLNHVAGKIFTSEYGPMEDWFFENNVFRLNDNFGILTGGLVFGFNPYEVGPYAAGSPQVFIPYEEIAGLIKTDGILNRFGEFKEQPVEEKINAIVREVESINNSNLVKDSIVGFGDYTTDGGTMYVYKDRSGALKKMELYLFGEGGRSTSEFYLRNDKLICHHNQSYTYNSPYFMEDFDPDQTVMEEEKYYFDQYEKLIRWIDKDSNIIAENEIPGVTEEAIMKFYKDLCSIVENEGKD